LLRPIHGAQVQDPRSSLENPRTERWQRLLQIFDLMLYLQRRMPKTERILTTIMVAFRGGSSYGGGAGDDASLFPREASNFFGGSP
jgi:hypothetical protein